MARRLIDIGVSGVGLVLLSPLLLVVAGLVRLTSRGPVLHRAVRAGRGGEPFELLKFRTMHVGAERRSRVTASGDSRVTWVGRWLRMTKLDELPQLISVVRGDMSLIGPRPEALDIVTECFATEHWRTLSVRPGMASPGSLYNYTHAEQQLDGPDVEAMYVRDVLPVKLALELYYVDHASLGYDLRILVRTGRVLVARTAGRRTFAEPPELRIARERYLVATKWDDGDPAPMRHSPQDVTDGPDHAVNLIRRHGAEQGQTDHSFGEV